MTDKKRCFVVMGFGIKTDLATGRKLNLDNAYQNMIKPAVEETGLECVRADEIPHSGDIAVEMYLQLLTADVVVADISTANPNAIYELGIRHALRPRTTVVISESGLTYPFDLNHILITSYTHLGDDVGVGEARRFRQLLSSNLRQILERTAPDSPVYTILADLSPPRLAARQRQVADQATEVLKETADALSSQQPSSHASSLSTFIDQGEKAIRRSDFAQAKAMFQAALGSCDERNRSNRQAVRREPYLLQRLALTTYKARQPTAVAALREALEILQPLSPEDSNDPETVGLVASIHKHLYQEGEGEDHLRQAIRFFSRGYFLRNDLYHGINLAALLTLRAASPLAPTEQERIADLVFANRIRTEIVGLCRAELELIDRRLETTTDHDTKEHQVRQDWERRYWCTATLAGAYFGLGAWPEYRNARADAAALYPATWMATTLDKYLATILPALEQYGHLLAPPWQPDDA